MKAFLRKTFSTGNYDASVSASLLFMRVVIGLFFVFTHGYGKFQMLLSGEIMFPGVLGLSPAVSLTLATVAEFLAAILLIFGFATRFSSFLLMVTMLVAGLIFHYSDPFSAKELALVYAAIFAVFTYLGAGKYSIDSKVQV